MNAQIVLYVVAAFALALFLRRAWRIRSLRHYAPADVDGLLKSKVDVLLLDVRTDAEFRAGSLRGAVHIPLPSLRSRLKELEKYRGKDIVCFCQSGNRSVSAALLLRGEGFKVANLRGGLVEWKFAHR
jgi:rhodanese-related sulfurtransferase